MAFDPAPRIDELLEHLRIAYGVADRQAAELLLSTTLRIDGMGYPYITIETDWMSTRSSGAWFSFAGLLTCVSFGTLRSKRPRYAGHDLDAIVEAVKSRPVILVESEWRSTPKMHPRLAFYNYEVFARAVRVRTKHPKSLGVLAHGPEAEVRVSKLAHLAKSAVSSELRTTGKPKYALPGTFAFWCELAMKLARPGVGWEWLTNALVEVASRRAVLYNRTAVDAEDWRLAGRAAADLIPAHIHDILNEIATDGAWYGHAKISQPWRWPGESAQLLDHERMSRELKRLHSTGIVDISRPSKNERWRARIDVRVAEFLPKLLAGECFG